MDARQRSLACGSSSGCLLLRDLLRDPMTELERPAMQRWPTMYLFLITSLLVELCFESQVMYLFCGQGRARLVWWEYPRHRSSPVFIIQRTNNVNLFLQRLLLVHTPPRPEVQLGPEHGVAWEAGSNGRGSEGFDGSLGRRRTITRLTDGSPTPRPRTRLMSAERRLMADGLQNAR